MRHGLSSDLAFSPADRTENIRRIGEVAGLFADAGFIVLSAFISPYRVDRELARSAASDAFHEIYIEADVANLRKTRPQGSVRQGPARGNPGLHRHIGAV